MIFGSHAQDIVACIAFRYERKNKTVIKNIF